MRELPEEDKLQFLDKQEHEALGALYRFEMDKRKVEKLMKLPRFKDNSAQLQYANKLQEMEIMSLELNVILDTVDDMRKDLG